jgi:hypothetical protein
MGRRDRTLGSKRDALEAILRAIDQANRHSRRRLLDLINQAIATRLGQPLRKPKAVAQAWWRWTNGINVPPVWEAAQIVLLANRHNWLVGVTDESAIKLVRWLSDEPHARGQSNKTRPLGSLQPRSRKHRDAWSTTLTLAVSPGVSLVMEHLEEFIPRAPPGKGRGQLSLFSANTKMAATRFRATLIELACQLLEAVDRGLPDPELSDDETISVADNGVSFLDAGNRIWPGILRDTGDDLRMMLHMAARSVSERTDARAATSSTRERLLATCGKASAGGTAEHGTQREPLKTSSAARSLRSAMNR